MALETFHSEMAHVIENADSTGVLALDGKSRMNEMAVKMNEIKSSVDRASSVIGNLNSISVEIGNIIDVMDGISSQTNLLALNAAIEAARAGEAGKGFAVVAEEIRKLAEASLSSSENIRNLIQNTQKGTQDALSAIEAGSRDVHEGVTTIKHVESSFENIIGSFENTKISIHKASESLESIESSSRVIISNIEEIDKIAQDGAANSEEVAASSEEQAASAEQIADSIENLMKMINGLSCEIERFSVKPSDNH